MTTINPDTAQRLAQAEAEAEALRAELAQAAADRAARLDDAQARWERDLIARHREVDQQLQARGTEHAAAFTQSARAGDLPAAYSAWIHELATRYARYAVRNEAINAENRQRTGSPVLPELTMRDSRFLERLQEEGEKAANTLGNTWADDLVGERPTETD